jgi:flagellar hook assembly protein FlgD
VAVPHKSAAIRFTLAKKGQVEISVFDVNGRVVKTLIDGVVDAGENALTWDGTDNRGNPVGAGIFWMKMRTPGYESTKRMVVMR